MILKFKSRNFYQYKRPISVDNIDFKKIVVYNKISFDKNDFKYLIGYKDAKNWTFVYVSSKNECIWKRFCIPDLKFHLGVSTLGNVYC